MYRSNFQMNNKLVFCLLTYNRPEIVDIFLKKK